MKTLHIPGKNKNLSSIPERVRLVLIPTGIVTAVICLLALLNETKSAENEVSRNRLIETSRIVAADFSIGVASRAVVAAVWPF